MLGSTIAMAVREIRRNTMRSVLTTLGIVIGVGAVIAMVTLGRGAAVKITADIAQMGNSLLIVMPGSDHRGPTTSSASSFKIADARAIERELATVAEVAPVASRSVLAVYGNKNYTTTVNGSNNAFFSVRGFTLASGRPFSDSELLGGTPVCILGTTVQHELFGAQDPLSAVIRVGKIACLVTGTLKSKGQSTLGPDQDDLLVMPLPIVQRRFAGNTDVNMLYVSARSDRHTDRAKGQIEALMRERRRIVPGQPNDFSVQDMKEISRTLDSVIAALTALLGAIAAVSLLVGGIGIMNIMLVSVTERTGEIGLRLAIGALAQDVLLQFLVEAMALSMVGGVLGLAVGVGSSMLVAALVHLPLVLKPDIAALAVGFSAAVGVGFGYLPARQAARLNPIEALRHA